MEFDWDEYNTGHIARHKVTPEEAEQAITNHPLLLEIQTDELSGELRTVEVGPTNAKRLLVVVWTMRSEWCRVVTAFNADRRTRTLYRKHFEGEKT